MPHLPSIQNFMDAEVHTVHLEMPLMEAIQSLLDHHVTGAPVVDNEGRLVGILTELDCLNLLAAGSDAHPADGTVSDYMTRSVYSVPPHTNIYFAAGVFLSNHFRRLPIVKDGKLVGAITRLDILRAVAANKDLVPQWSNQS